MNEEMDSVGPLQQETMGRTERGSLWSLGKKYSRWGRSLWGGERAEWVVWSMTPAFKRWSKNCERQCVILGVGSACNWV